MSDMKKIEGFLYAVKTHKDIIYSINLRGDILSFKNPLLCEGSRTAEDLSELAFQSSPSRPVWGRQLSLSG